MNTDLNLPHPHFPQNQEMPLDLPGNFGEHRVNNISKNIMGGVVDAAQHQYQVLDHKWEAMGDPERGYYAIAALCVIIALILFFILGMTLGPMSLLHILPAGGALAAAGAGALLRGRSLGDARTPWEMPPYSPEVKQNEQMQKRWRELWGKRNQAKSAYENVKERIASKEKSHLDVVIDKAFAKDLLKAYEDAEIAFWRFADKEIAREKIDEINENRQKRGELDPLV